MMISLDGQPIYQPFPNYNSYVAELVNGTIYIPYNPVQSRQKFRIPEFILFIDNLLAEVRIQKLTAIIALIYCDRLKLVLPSKSMGDVDTIHRIYIAALALACKFTGEKFGHKDLAKASQIYTVKEINTMEMELLTMISYDIWVTKAQVKTFLNENQEGLFYS